MEVGQRPRDEARIGETASVRLGNGAQRREVLEQERELARLVIGDRRVAAGRADRDRRRDPVVELDLAPVEPESVRDASAVLVGAGPFDDDRPGTAVRGRTVVGEVESGQLAHHRLANPERLRVDRRHRPVTRERSGLVQDAGELGRREGALAGADRSVAGERGRADDGVPHPAPASSHGPRRTLPRVLPPGRGRNARLLEATGLRRCGRRPATFRRGVSRRRAGRRAGVAGDAGKEERRQFVAERFGVPVAERWEPAGARQDRVPHGSHDHVGVNVGTETAVSRASVDEIDPQQPVGLTPLLAVGEPGVSLMYWASLRKMRATSGLAATHLTAARMQPATRRPGWWPLRSGRSRAGPCRSPRADDLLDHLLFRGEVVVKAAREDPGLLGDIPHRRRVDALRREDLGRDLEQLVASGALVVASAGRRRRRRLRRSWSGSCYFTPSGRACGGQRGVRGTRRTGSR